MNQLKKFFYTYTRILKLAYQVHPGFLFVLTVNNLLWGLSNLPVVYINKYVIDLVVSNLGIPNWQPVAQNIVILLLFRVLIEVLRSLMSRIDGHVSQAFSSLMSDRIVVILGDQLNKLDIPTVESAEFQDKYAKIRSQSHNRIWGMLKSLQQIPNALATIVSGIIPLFSFNPILILLVGVVVVPDAIVSLKLAQLEYQEREKRSRLYRVLGWLDWLITNVSQFYENKIAANIGYVSQKMRNLQDEIYKNDVRYRLRRAKYRTLSDIPSHIFSFVLNAYFFINALIGRITIGTAQLLYLSANTLENGLAMLMSNFAEIYEHYLFVNDFSWFMDLKSKQLGTKNFPPKIKKGIKFDQVWFKYPNSEQWVLKDISFEIKAHENLALVGENGAGKTTLLKLLLGFYLPTKGKITIDGIDISDFSPESYWKQISALSQEYHLYPFSAKESIAFSDLSRLSEIENIKKAAMKAKIDTYISALPKGYDTPLTRDLDGIEPSGGQKQRIAIARTLFKTSQIVLLDEPTSNVDPKTEEEIFANIIDSTKKQIVLLVSHRFSTVRKADRIILLDFGEVAEIGSHQELIDRDRKYAHLFNLQAKSYQ